MRKLILVNRRLYVRDFLVAGAFDEIEDDETFYTSGPDAEVSFEGNPRYIGPTDMSQSRTDAYGTVRDLLLTHYRWRSRTAKVKLAERPFLARTQLKLRAMPGVRHARIRRVMRTTGVHQELLEKMRELRPDVVIAPAAGIDGLVFDLIRCAKHLDIPSVALMYNWDNLSSKAAFAIQPDYVGVGGFQGAEHATQIHGIPPDRVGVLGSPYIDRYFRHSPGSTKSPFPFRYVLFAGCYQPFDEGTALRLLNEEIERRGLDLKVVYLPHPRRLRRAVDEFVDDEALDHVIVEPNQREGYIAGYDKWRADPRSRKMGMRPLSLDYYPALLENAEFVVCPLSTMMLEAAILRRRVLVIAYHDGVHRTSPGVAINYLHFEGVDRVDTFEVCRQGDQLVPTFARMAEAELPPVRPPKEQMDYWVYHDDCPFSARLKEWVDEIGRRHGVLPGESRAAERVGLR